mgnify:FL=1|jgi:hypothetical protein
MIAGNYNIVCEQGATFIRVLQLKQPDPSDPTGNTYIPYDLYNHTARMQVRRTYESSTFQVELTTENGGISVEPGDEQGIIYLSMDDATTAGLTSDGVYDLEIVSPGGSVNRVIRGTFTLNLEVTR